MEVSNDTCIAQHLRFVSAGDEQEKKQPLSGFDTSNEAWTFTKIVISRGKHFHFCAGFPLGTYMHLSSGCLCLSHSSRDS